jgi:hypothetical protein
LDKEPNSQKNWLIAVKKALSKAHLGLTWDDLARMATIEPRALKTYRMPDDSPDYREMPALARRELMRLMEQAGEPAAETAQPKSDPLDLMVPALADLVIRQARLSLIEDRMVAGVDRTHTIPVGLDVNDRRAMALVSRACLQAGLPDHGAEIHHLLERSTHPLGEWLSIPEIEDAGYGDITLIEPEEGVPTPEAEDLARGFSSITGSLEEQLFGKFLELLSRYPESSADAYYTRVRDFVVRHPVCTVDTMKELGSDGDLPPQLWIMLQQQFYEAVPEGWNIEKDGVPLCAHCGDAMKRGRSGLVCSTLACSAVHPTKSRGAVPAANLMRVSRGIRQYWVEPGLDEIRLFDALRDLGLDPELYPHRDRVDIAVREIGIDLKNYASPEMLGRKFKQSAGGLIEYPERLLVIPDWVVAGTPSYLDRLRHAMERTDILAMSVTDAIKYVRRACHA